MHLHRTLSNGKRKRFVGMPVNGGSEMAKAFSVASWNVEHFGDEKTAYKIGPVVKYIANQKADVVAVYEVKSNRVFRPLIKAMSGYQFHITEGPQMQEILIGIRRGVTAYVTQKLQFKAGQSTLRPGVLVSVYVDGVFYPVLFLHLKSSPDPKGFGLRDDMIRRAFRFRGTLDKVAGGSGKANYIFVGDLNTMGLDYSYKKHDISAPDEIKEVERRAPYRRMKVLTKNAPYTWWNGTQSEYEPANLDHVVAAEHLRFRSFGGAEVDVRGWPKEPTDAKKDAWIAKHSDHALLFFEVQKV